LLYSQLILVFNYLSIIIRLVILYILYEVVFLHLHVTQYCVHHLSCVMVVIALVTKKESML